VRILGDEHPAWAGASASRAHCRCGDVESTLHGYAFTDETYLETVFTDTHSGDLGWAYDAWRSVTRSAA
jgi:hypothetical protein